MGAFWRRPTWAALLATGALVAGTLPANAAGAGSATSTAQRAPASAGPAADHKAPGGDALHPQVSTASKHDSSAPLRTVAHRNAATYQRELRKLEGARPTPATPRLVLPKASSHGKAPAKADAGSARLQQAMPTRAGMPDFQADFEGINNIDGVYPPDTNGDVGGNYYVQWVNLSFQVFDKHTGASLLGPLPGNALWAGFGGPCETTNDGDPIAQYDPLANRWMLSQFAPFSGIQCIAVSQTGDPTGAYYRYSFTIDPTIFNDYPKFGVWPDGYYMSINQFNQALNTYRGAGAVAFERTQMLQGLPAQMVYFSLENVNIAFGGQLPSDLDGTAPPVGAPNVFLEADDNSFGFPTDRLNGWNFHVDWANPAGSTFGNSGQPSFTLDTAPFDTNLCGYARSCIPQPGTTQGLDAISDRLMYRLQYRNFGDHQAMVVNHTVDVDGTDHAGVRWYELRSTNGGGTWSMQQQGTYAPDADNRWMGSIAMDVSGNVALGYSVASGTTYPSIRVAGRLAGDPAGELPQPENQLIAGTGSQTGTAGRWGDYSAMQVDPADQCTFYYTQEYIATTGPVPWQTRVGSFKFPNCTAGPSGTIAGTVTDGTGNPVAGATVTAGASSTVTDDQGHYTFTLPVGTYDMTATAFGYDTDTANGVEVVAGQTTTQNFVLAKQPVVTISGTVRDGSGHGWPLYAKVRLQGTPLPADYTDPGTGFYSVDVPANQTYTLVVEAQYPGYLPSTEDVTVGGGDLSHDVRLLVDPATCSAPGYTVATQGTTQTFSSGTLPAGWSVVDNIGNGQVWQFDDPGNRRNLTGGQGGFAIVDSDHYGPGNSQDTSLVSPVVDLSGVTSPAVGFAQDYNNLNDVADVDLSTNGGGTWQTILHQTTDQRGPDFVTIPIPQAAGKAQVQVRFHYYDASWAWWWEVDDFFLGSRTCDKVRGGLVYGTVIDANTGAGINGATVTSDDHPADRGVTRATPNDPNLPDGWYWLFSSLTGTHPFTAKYGKYVAQTKDVNVRADWVREADFSLTAGRLVVRPQSLSATVTLGQSTTRTFTVTNNGTAPANVDLVERPGDFVILRPDGTLVRGKDILDAPGAPLKLIRGKFLPYNTAKGTSEAGENEGRPSDAEAWLDQPDYPTDIMDNALAYNGGLVYSVGGLDGSGNLTTAAYTYDPSALSYSPIANLPEAREKPGAAFIGGKLYVVGGWSSSGAPAASVLIYDPASDSWSTGATMLSPVAAPAVAAVNGKLYAFGGCDTGSSCGVTSAEVYDPATNAWTAIADYPEPTSWQSCGEISGTIYCAGGSAGSGTSKHTYSYSPASDSWTQLADLPIDLWASGYTAANGMLLVSGGVTDGFNTVTNQGFAYTPGTDTWAPLPNANEALYRGGSTCGFFRIGGSAGGFVPDAANMVLPGFDRCGTPVDVPWLRERPRTMTLAPGQTRTVTVTFDSSKVTQPGRYTAQIAFDQDTPYSVDPVAVRMVVNPPPSWGKLLGIVRGRSCSNVVAPLPGATVQVNGFRYGQTLRTTADGRYAIWIDSNVGQLQMIVAKDGYIPQVRDSRVLPAQVTRENFTLRRLC